MTERKQTLIKIPDFIEDYKIAFYSSDEEEKEYLSDKLRRVISRLDGSNLEVFKRLFNKSLDQVSEQFKKDLKKILG